MWRAEITLSDVQVDDANRLPGAHSFKDTGRVLAGTRNAVAWGALGHATAAYEIAAQNCSERTQFGKPLASFQIVQDKLVRVLAEVCAMQLYCLRLGRLIEEGSLTDTIAASAKMNNTGKARQVVAEARDLLGGNGILLDFHVMRHMADIEALHTYEAPRPFRRLSSDGTSPVSVPSREIRFVDVDGIRPRTAVAAGGNLAGPPLVLITGIGASLDLAAPFERELNRRGLPTISYAAPGSASRPRMPGRDAWAAWPVPPSDFSTRSGTARSTSSASRSAASSRSNLAHEAPDRVRRLVLAATGPGLGGVAGSPRVLWTLAMPRRYYRPDYYRRVAADLYGGLARRDPDALLHGSLARFMHRPTMRGYAAQLYSIAGWSSMLWLHRLREPTLVLAGDDDPIVPLVNRRILAGLIPDSDEIHPLSLAG